MNFKSKIVTMTSALTFTLCSLLLTSTAWSEQVVDVEPKADQILKQMSEYLAGMNKFTISSRSTIESMLDSGQKIMFDYQINSSVQRPDKLFVMRKGNMEDKSIYYNGKTVTFLNHAQNTYTSLDALSNISETLAMAINKFKLAAPGADLLYKDSYKRLSNKLISGFYLGKKLIDGVECHHLAFRNPDVDWQIWIQTGAKPLPKRYVITSRWITGAPQFRLDMNWNTNADFSDSIFNFVAPKNSKKLN